MNRTWYTGMSYARNLIFTFEQMGINTVDILERMGLDREVLDDADARMTETQKLILWEQALDQIDDPYFGLHVGAWSPLGRWGLVEFIIMNSRILEDAFENSIRYMRLMGDAKDAALTRIGQVVRYELIMERPRPDLYRHILECDAAYLIRLIRQTVSPSFVPLSVGFPHPSSGEPTVYEQTFQCPVYFQQPSLVLVFDPSWLSKPILSANPHLEAPLAVQAARLLAKWNEIESLAERISTLLQFDPGHMTVYDVCGHLNLGDRTLQRRLKEEGTSFRELQDAARKRQALEYLKDPMVPLGEISYLLGFSERSAFYRAVKRWVGMTAQEYRTGILNPA